MKHYSIILFLSFSAYANYPFPGKQRPLRVSGHEYQRYIRPQLGQIVNDFYGLLSLQNDETKPLVSAARSLDKIKGIVRSNKNHSPSFAPWRTFSKFDQDILKALKEVSLAPHCGPLAGIQEVSAKALYFTTPRSLKGQKAREKLESIFLSSEGLLLLCVSPDKKILLKDLFLNFIRPISRHYLSKNRGESIAFLKKELGRLTVYWNIFHSSYTKGGNIKTKPEERSKTLQMHRRWNSILKIVLR